MMSKDQLELAYIYYSGSRKSASVKNMLKTCDSLSSSEKLQVTLYSSLPVVDELYSLYQVKGGFRYVRSALGSAGLFPVELLDRLLFSLFTLFHLWRKGYDVVYTRDIFFLVLYRMAVGVREETTVVYECHNPYSRGSKFPGFLEDYALDLPDQIFCVSEGVKQNLEEQGIESELLTVQRNCIDLDDYSTRKPVDRELDGEIVLYLGSFKKRKGVEDLLAAFESFDREDVYLVLAGKNPGREIREVIEDSERIIYTGFLGQEDLDRWLRQADVAVHPSIDCEYQRRYTCPMKLLDYMASKTPAVACGLPTSRWIGESTLFYYETGNPDDLADRISYVLENPEEAERKADRAFHRVKEHYTYEHKTDKLEQFLQRKQI